MSGRVSTWAKVLAAVIAAAAAGGASASAGNGIRVGGADGRLHPFIDLETRYDSNVSYGAANEVVGDVILHVRPGLELKLPGDLATIEFTGAADWAQYLGAEDSTTKDLSKFYATAGFAALFNRRGPASVRLDSNFSRQVSATSLAASGTAVISNANNLNLSIPWTPGGGALVLTATGQWLVESFQKYKDDLPGGTSFGDLGYNQFRGGGEVQWRFLPRTSAIFSAGYFQRLPNVSLPDQRNEANGFDVLAGVGGLVTPRIGLSAKAGYGSTSTPAKDVGSFLADLGVDYLPMEWIAFRGGYARALGIDPEAGGFTSDGVGASARVKVGPSVVLRAGVRWDRLSFEAIPGAETRFLRVDPAIEGTFGKWLTVGLGYVYSSRDVTWPDLAVPPPAYSKHEAFLKLGLTY